MIFQRPWQWIRKEATVLVVLLTLAIAVFTGMSVYIGWRDYTADQDTREYIAGIRKGEYKIERGKGEYIGYKFLVDDSGSPGWYWKKNTEPSQITEDNADGSLVFGWHKAPRF